MRRIDTNDGQVAVMECQKHESMEVAATRGPTATEDSILSITAQYATFLTLCWSNDLKMIANSRFDAWDMDANRQQLIAQRQLQNLNSTQETCIEVSLSSIHPEKAPRHIDLLKNKLQLSFGGCRHEKEPILKGESNFLCFSEILISTVLLFLHVKPVYQHCRS